MSIHTDGYVTDIAYVNNFYRDLSPNFIRPTLLLNALDFPTRQEGEPFRYLELGFGMGTSLNVNAATCEGEFWGNDFITEHVSYARRLAGQSGVNVHILPDSFKELNERTKKKEIPAFDMIAMHGIWSWVNKESREHILSIINHSLKSGGILYVNYNTLPGWADFLPIRNLLATFAHYTSEQINNSTDQFKGAISFIQNLMAKDFKFLTDNPHLMHEVNNFDMQNIAYYIHEYMNDNWNAFYFKDVANELARVHCSFVSSSRLLNQMSLSLPENSVDRIQTIANPIFRETLRDYAQNQKFRTDIFIKKHETSYTQEQLLEDKKRAKQELAMLKFTLTSPLDSVNLEIKTVTGLKIETVIGNVHFPEKFALPILKACAYGNYKAKTIGEIQKSILCQHIEAKDFFNTFQTLLGAGILHVAQTPTEEVRKQTTALNLALCKTVYSKTPSNILASSVLGSAIAVPRIDLLLIIAHLEGKTIHKDVIPAVLAALKEIGDIQNPDGTIPGDDELSEFIRREFELFLMIRLPFYQSIGTL